MTFKKFNSNEVIQLLILKFWTGFWLFNVIDKFIGEPTFLWKGKDRLEQLTGYFNSIELYDKFFPVSALYIATALEIAAFLFMLFALMDFIQNKKQMAKNNAFKGSVMAMILFTFFSLGDQVFGDRVELLEHTIYWGLVIYSYVTYLSLENSPTVEK